MDAILALLNRLAAATTDDERTAITAELNAALAALTADELAEIDAALRGSLAEADTARQSAETAQRAELIAQMRTLRDGILAVGAEQTRRDEEQAASDEEAAALLAEVTPPAAEDDTPAEGETPAEGTDGEGTEGGEGGEGTQTTPEGAETTPEAIAASAAPRPRRAPLATLNRMQSPATVPIADRHGLTLVAAGGAPGIVREGAEITDRRVLGALVKERLRNLGPGRGNSEDKVVIASAVREVPTDRQLGDDPTVNAARLDAAREELTERCREFLRMSPAAMVAAGGFCGITTPYYDRMTVAQRGRPTRDGYTISMQAPRAGIRFAHPFSLSDIPVGNAPRDAVFDWDNATDISALSGSDVKPCWHVDCDEFVEELISAVGICIEYGNLGQMSLPELFAQATELADVAHDRRTETLLLDAIKADSVFNTRARLLGAAKDFFAALDLASAAVRAEQRMEAGNPAADAPLVALAPDWLIEACRIDVLRSAYPGETSWDFSVERVMGLFRSRGVVPTFYVDSPTDALQIPTVAADGDPLAELPTHAEWCVSVPGAHIQLEAPELNVGLVRDSVLNAKNNARVFSESFQGHAYIGPAKGSVWVRQELCADGSAAALVDTTDACGTTAS